MIYTIDGTETILLFILVVNTEDLLNNIAKTPARRSSVHILNAIFNFEIAEM